MTEKGVGGILCLESCLQYSTHKVGGGGWDRSTKAAKEGRYRGERGGPWVRFVRLSTKKKTAEKGDTLYEKPRSPEWGAGIQDRGKGGGLRKRKEEVGAGGMVNVLIRTLKASEKLIAARLRPGQIYNLCLGGGEKG